MNGCLFFRTVPTCEKLHCCHAALHLASCSLTVVTSPNPCRRSQVWQKDQEKGLVWRSGKLTSWHWISLSTTTGRSVCRRTPGRGTLQPPAVSLTEVTESSSRGSSVGATWGQTYGGTESSGIGCPSVPLLSRPTGFVRGCSTNTGVIW